MPGLGLGLGDLLGRIGQELNIGPYKDREENAAIAKAMGKYQNNPQTALQALAEIDPVKAMEFQKNQVANAKVQSTQLLDQDKYDANTQSMLAGMARASNANTWPAMRAQMENLARSRGYKPTIGFPDEYDETFADSFTNSAVSPEEITKLKSTEAYRDAALGLNERKANADVALKTGALKVKAAEIAGRQGVAAGNTGVAAARVMKPSGKGGSAAGGSKPTMELPPPGKPEPGARKLNKRTGTVWFEKNGEWTK